MIAIVGEGFLSELFRHIDTHFKVVCKACSTEQSLNLQSGTKKPNTDYEVTIGCDNLECPSRLEKH